MDDDSIENHFEEMDTDPIVKMNKDTDIENFDVRTIVRRIIIEILDGKIPVYQTFKKGMKA